MPCDQQREGMRNSYLCIWSSSSFLKKYIFVDANKNIKIITDTLDILYRSTLKKTGSTPSLTWTLFFATNTLLATQNAIASDYREKKWRKRKGRRQRNLKKWKDRNKYMFLAGNSKCNSIWLQKKRKKEIKKKKEIKIKKVKDKFKRKYKYMYYSGH